MALTLTPEDLQAVASLIKDAITTLVPPLVEQIVDTVVEAKIEELKLMIAAGFAEVDQRFHEVYQRLDRLETTLADTVRLQQTEIDRVDGQQAQLDTIRTHLHAV